MELNQKALEIINQITFSHGTVQLIEGDFSKNSCILIIEDAEFKVETANNFLEWKIINLKRNNKIWKHEKFFKKYIKQIEEIMNEINMKILEEEANENPSLELEEEVEEKIFSKEKILQKEELQPLKLTEETVKLKQVIEIPEQETNEEEVLEIIENSKTESQDLELNEVQEERILELAKDLNQEEITVLKLESAEIQKGFLLETNQQKELNDDMEKKTASPSTLEILKSLIPCAFLIFIAGFILMISKGLLKDKNKGIDEA